MKLFACAAALVGLAAAVPLDLSRPALSQNIIEMVNNDPESTWTAGVNNRFLEATLEDVRALCGALPGPQPPEATHLGKIDAKDIPDEFDARTNWPNCKSIAEIRDQSECGSCWAFGAVEAMTDRYCIASSGSVTPHISAADMLSCCTSCGFGCQGGYPSAAWDWWHSAGVVTGGENESKDGCLPYPFPYCEHHTTGPYPPCGSIRPTPPCTKQCIPEYKTKSYNDDKNFAKAASYRLTAQNVQEEIMTYGPVEAAFDVYEDFLTYKSGVYQHKTGSLLGGHAVKVMGWGVEKGTPYWLIANSWNPSWGDNGTFKILRGSDECGIEDYLVAGQPQL